MSGVEHTHGDVTHSHAADLGRVDRDRSRRIAVRDLDATVAWYEKMFGAEVAHQERIESDGVEEALIKVADSYIQLLTPYTDTSPAGQVHGTQRRGHPPRRLPGRLDRAMCSNT